MRRAVVTAVLLFCYFVLASVGLGLVDGTERAHGVLYPALHSALFAAAAAVAITVLLDVQRRRRVSPGRSSESPVRPPTASDPPTED
ncbi:hypothetical protein ACFXPR_23500 [Nocardia tengchongensis]|uniref:hypothetical protein n=1 Tax=Nocardia tengchongensis TaxID=2055889 RepID=UPI0036CC47CD